MSILNFWKPHGVMGINARNYQYLPLNNLKSVRLADDKLRTKSFLSARGITVPKLIAKITKFKELEKFNFNTLPGTFVLKPNSGYGGEGILVLERNGENFVIASSRRVLTVRDLKNHIRDILDGRFAIRGFGDQAFFEQRLITHHSLAHLTPYGGLPDVRIICYNLIPTIAMLRLPTRESGGRANTHQGGIGIGIDLGTGRTTYAAQYNFPISEIPGLGQVSGIRIPYFEKMLLMAAKINQSLDMGYLAVDIVPDENTGPTLLEINARAGLMIQLANRVPLRKRFERIKGIKITSPEKGVRISQDLFGTNIKNNFEIEHLHKNIVGLREEIEIILPHGSKKIIARISPSKTETYLDQKILEQIRQGTLGKTSENPVIKFVLGGRRYKVKTLPKKFMGDYQMLIGASGLTDILINPKKEIITKITAKSKTPSSNNKENYEKILSYDRALSNIDEKIKFLYYLRPRNLITEKDKFFSQKNYNPHFEYPAPEFSLEESLQELDQINFDATIPCTQIFIDKKRELITKLKLISLCGRSEFTATSHELFAAVKENILELAENEMKKFQESKESERNFSSQDLKQHFEKIFHEYGIQGWKILLQTNLISSCTVQPRQQTILISEETKFSHSDLERLTYHEIYTHVFTALNGDLQPYRLLKVGTSRFLETQEGLAIYNQTHFAKNKNGASKAALLYYVISQAQEKSFRKVYEILIDRGISPELAWKLTLKSKRGMSDTQYPGGLTKDLVYFHGYLKIQNFVAVEGDLSRLYIGKLNMRDLESIKHLPNIKAPQYLPPFLKR